MRAITATARSPFADMPRSMAARLIPAGPERRTARSLDLTSPTPSEERNAIGELAAATSPLLRSLDETVLLRSSIDVLSRSPMDGDLRPSHPVNTASTATSGIVDNAPPAIHLIGAAIGLAQGIAWVCLAPVRWYGCLLVMLGRALGGR